MQFVLRSAVSGQIPDVAGAAAAAHGPRPPHGNMLSHYRDDNLYLDYDDEEEEDHTYKPLCWLHVCPSVHCKCETFM